jgi:hypothetical protein
VSRKSWPQNVGVNNVYYGLKCCVNWENNETTVQEEVDKRIRSLIFQDPRISGRADFTTVHWMVIIILPFEML